MLPRMIASTNLSTNSRQDPAKPFHPKVIVKDLEFQQNVKNYVESVPDTEARFSPIKLLPGKVGCHLRAGELCAFASLTLRIQGQITSKVDHNTVVVNKADISAVGFIAAAAYLSTTYHTVWMLLVSAPRAIWSVGLLRWCEHHAEGERCSM